MSKINADKTTQRTHVVQVNNYVWCDRSCGIHEDSLNPYGYEPDSWCDEVDHRPVFVKAFPAEGAFG